MDKRTNDVLNELIEAQEKKLFEYAQTILPDLNLTRDDILQPNDYPELEMHPSFRYEEGVLKGLHAAKMALVAY